MRARIPGGILIIECSDFKSSVASQQFLFNLGFRWSASGTTILKREIRYIFVRDNGYITHSMSLMEDYKVAPIDASSLEQYFGLQGLSRFIRDNSLLNMDICYG